MIDQPARQLAEEGGDTTAPAGGGERRLVEVAVDAVGSGGSRTYTYAVPDRLADVGAGEAVLVEFGRRQAVGIVLGAAEAQPGVEPKAIADRIRADGPLLPPLSLELARWIAAHYLAPPALALRAMLPPEMLERLELVAERRPPDEGSVATTTISGLDDVVDRDLVDQLDRGPRPVRDLASPDGRAGLVRRLRGLEARGWLSLDWILTGAGAGPRFERWLVPTADGIALAALIAAGEPPPGRRLGPNQLAALEELALAAEPPGAGLPAADLAARHGSSSLAGLVRRGLVQADVRERPRRPLAARPPGLRGGRPPAATLTAAQSEAIAIATQAIAEGDPTPLLLDGVTGGGKTAIYVEAIAACLERGRPALVLVPEIALALPLVDRLRADLSARVALVHSGLGAGERADEWRRIRAADVDIVVGTRLAVLAPLADVGLVVVDEEHEGAYKSDRTPRLQARDTAIRLAQLAAAALVLGSATPAVDSVGHAREGRYRRVELPSRPVGQAPTVELVDLRLELQEGNRGLISRRLGEALAVLDATSGEQAVLVINRRGTASVVLCRDCGHVQACPECGRPLVYHQAGMTLRCHHCGRATPLAARCPGCGSPRIRYLGGGTERVEREVRERFPGLRVGRLDRDVVERRGAAARVIDAFAAGRLDALVGTGLVAKGLDIPNVTLVGVVSADVALNLPDERAAERTYQLLAQAVGRAGRGDRPGTAIIQTYQPGHAAIQAVVRADPAAFYDAELDLRRRFGSPPFGRLVKLTVGLAERDAAESAARAMADRLRALAAERGTAVAVIGPAPAYIARRADRWRWNLVLRGSDPAALLDGGVEPPWSVDVDPESLL
ncbi:MAG: primosomal protein N' [Chloroflexota bacterium]|nr:primosomal protein N' [Chloroflexota bacterium]